MVTTEVNIRTFEIGYFQGVVETSQVAKVVVAAAVAAAVEVMRVLRTLLLMKQVRRHLALLKELGLRRRSPEWGVHQQLMMLSRVAAMVRVAPVAGLETWGTS